MEFRQFRYVLKVAEERNFSSAAKKLFISQPSLSQFIQKVEEQVGAPLFDRSVSPLKLTTTCATKIPYSLRCSMVLSCLPAN